MIAFFNQKLTQVGSYTYIERDRTFGLLVELIRFRNGI